MPTDIPEPQAVCDSISRSAIFMVATLKAGPDSASTVRATYTKGKHSAVVDIAFTETSYSIHYVDSANLGYGDHRGKTVIHSSYNKALTALREAIDGALRTAN